MAKHKMIIVATHATDDAERATIPFVMANAALAIDMDVTVVLQAEGVRLAIKDYARKIQAQAFPPLHELMDGFGHGGGTIMVCVPCLRARNIDERQVVEGIKLVAAGKVVAEIADSDSQLCY